jgi:hypothetical protein
VPVLGLADHVDQGKARQVLDLLKRNRARPQAWVADREQRLPEQPLGPEARPVAAAVADLQVGIGLAELEAVDGRGQAQADARVLGEELPQTGHQPEVGERGADPDRDGPAAPAAEQLLRPGGQVVERPAQDRQVALAGVGEDERAGLAGEEPGAQPVLQVLDLLADGGRRDAQLLGRLGEAGMPRRRLEGAQPVQGGKTPPHSTLFHTSS